MTGLDILRGALSGFKTLRAKGFDGEIDNGPGYVRRPGLVDPSAAWPG